MKILVTFKVSKSGKVRQTTLQMQPIDAYSWVRNTYPDACNFVFAETN